jgi:hypothetical protein
MKTNITVIGITKPIPDWENHPWVLSSPPPLKSDIMFMVNPPSLKIFYPVIERVSTAYFLDTDLLNGTRYVSHELRNLIIYED